MIRIHRILKWKWHKKSILNFKHYIMKFKKYFGNATVLIIVHFSFQCQFKRWAITWARWKETKQKNALWRMVCLAVRQKMGRLLYGSRATMLTFTPLMSMNATRLSRFYTYKILVHFHNSIKLWANRLKFGYTRWCDEDAFAQWMKVTEIYSEKER